MACTCSLAPARTPVSLPSRCTSPRHVTPAQSRGRALRTRGALPAGIMLQVAEEATKYGAVEAPVEAVVGGAVVVTLVALASTFAFKSGFEAQEDMAERTKDSFNKKKRPGTK